MTLKIHWRRSVVIWLCHCKKDTFLGNVFGSKFAAIRIENQRTINVTLSSYFCTDLTNQVVGQWKVGVIWRRAAGGPEASPLACISPLPAAAAQTVGKTGQEDAGSKSLPGEDACKQRFQANWGPTVRPSVDSWVLNFFLQFGEPGKPRFLDVIMCWLSLVNLVNLVSYTGYSYTQDNTLHVCCRHYDWIGLGTPQPTSTARAPFIARWK